MQVLVLENKMTCAMKLDYSDEEPHSLVLTQRQDRSRRLELGLDAVYASACSTTFYCIVFRTVESDDFFRSVWHIQTGTQDLFWNNLLDELLVTVEKLHLPFS